MGDPNCSNMIVTADELWCNQATKQWAFTGFRSGLLHCGWHAAGPAEGATPVAEARSQLACGARSVERPWPAGGGPEWGRGHTLRVGCFLFIFVHTHTPMCVCVCVRACERVCVCVFLLGVQGRGG